jgi:uncharacterized protein (DUF58 family)
MSANLSLLPAPRLIALAVGAAVSALGLLVVPAAAPLLAAVDIVLVWAAVLDFWFTPGPRVLRVMRMAPERVSLLTRQEIVLLITNQAPMALRLRLRDAPPLELQTEEGADWCGVVPAEGEVQVRYVVLPAVRGQHAWGPIHIRYRSLWGLWERGLVVPGGQTIRVYPGLADIERYHLLARANRLEQLGVRKVKARGQTEFESLRDYAEGDDVRLLDWKATARRSRLTVRQLRTERNQSIILLIDSGRLMNAEEAGATKLDHAINAALLLAHVGLTRGDKVGLCTFSHKQHAWVAPRSQPGHQQILTETLYDLRGDFTESDHGRALAAVSARHGKRALLVVLTDFTDAATAQEMVAQVAHAGRRHLVLLAALKDRYLLRPAGAGADGTSSIKEQALSPVTIGFRQAVALELLHQRAEVLEALRRHGVQVIDVAPGDLAPAVLNKYLEVTFRGLL